MQYRGYETNEINHVLCLPKASPGDWINTPLRMEIEKSYQFLGDSQVFVETKAFLRALYFNKHCPLSMKPLWRGLLFTEDKLIFLQAFHSLTHLMYAEGM